MKFKKWLGTKEPIETISFDFKTIPAPKKTEKIEKPEDEWIWVEGYKGTDKDMCCLKFQYELLKPYDLEAPEHIKECFYGYHLCRYLCDVFEYYPFQNNNRFFRVRALVKKKDYEEYGDVRCVDHYGDVIYKNKLVAKSIIFISELTTDDLFEMYCDDFKHWSTEDKELARLKGVEFVAEEIMVRELVSLGYSRPFAEFLNRDRKFEIAKAVGSQEDLSMDMKVAYIMRSNK